MMDKADCRMRVLLIEDDATDRRLISRSLRKSVSQVELDWADRVAFGLAKLAEATYDVVLTDLTLPDSIGLATVERIRAEHPDVPIIVLTALDDKEIEMSSLTVGAQDYLIKDDATPRTLERAIQHAIQRQESVVEIRRLLAEVESSRKQIAEKKELLKRKNQRLRRLYRTAQRFVDNVSHEFRTPLTVIKDYVSLVREGMVGEVNDEQRRMLDVAGVRADDLNNMVDDMLDVSKLESGLLGAWRRPCDLTDILVSASRPLERKAAVKNIAFDVDIDTDLPLVYCDAEKVSRVVINLVTNAMKFCGDPGNVRLWAQCEHERGEVVVGVADDGAGIDEEGVAAIFRRFKQLKTKLKSGTKGFGLGLNIAKELVDLNFGEMSIESRPGQGTTFTFTVPLDDPQGVMQRFLHRLKRGVSKSNVSLVLIAARIDDATSEANAEDADAFFNYILRRNDLLFRTGTHDWLFVLPVPACELHHFTARANKEFEKTNRNRPFGPIPRFQMEVVGTYSLPGDVDEILDRFNSMTEIVTTDA